MARRRASPPDPVAAVATPLARRMASQPAKQETRLSAGQRTQIFAARAGYSRGASDWRAAANRPRIGSRPVDSPLLGCRDASCTSDAFQQQPRRRRRAGSGGRRLIWLEATAATVRRARRGLLLLAGPDSEFPSGAPSGCALGGRAIISPRLGPALCRPSPSIRPFLSKEGAEKKRPSPVAAALMLVAVCGGGRRSC